MSFRAMRVRQALGGGMRQAGVLAACCLYGLEHVREDLKKDLSNAKKLAEGICSNQFKRNLLKV